MKVISALLILCLFVLTSCFNSNLKEVDCKSFLDGSFKYKESSGNEGIIEIENGIHTEIYNDSTKIISKMVWTDKCSYYLKAISVEQNDFVKVGDSLEVKIIHIKNNEMKYKANYKGMELSETLVKIK